MPEAQDLPRDVVPVCQELIRRKFLVDYRPKAGVRVSPHFYNSDDEVLGVVEEIAQITARAQV